MSDISGAADPLKEVVEKMKKEAFAAGWSAAMQAVSQAIGEIVAPEGIENIEPGSPGPRRQSGGNAGGSLPTVGTTPHYVYEAVRTKQGMTGADVIAAVRAAGHIVGEAQIRTSLSRLEKRELLANRHKKWFLK